MTRDQGARALQHVPFRDTCPVLAHCDIFTTINHCGENVAGPPARPTGGAILPKNAFEIFQKFGWPDFSRNLAQIENQSENWPGSSQPPGRPKTVTKGFKARF